MVPVIKTRRGPKGIPVAKHNEIAQMALDQVPAAVAIERTGVSTTKVYEIYRNPVLKEIPSQEAA